jgi:ABC-type uncharacterized transport system substrate-binding protein
MGSDMQRREFIGLIGGRAAAWPFAAIAQQEQRTKLIGVFPSAGIDQSRVDAFLQAMQQFGWSDGRNVRFDIRFGAGDPETDRKRAEELVALAPAIIVAFGSLPVAALLQATRNVPVVFAGVVDPVSAGYVASLAACKRRRGDRITLVIAAVHASLVALSRPYAMSGLSPEMRTKADGEMMATVIREQIEAVGYTG